VFSSARSAVSALALPQIQSPTPPAIFADLSLGAHLSSLLKVAGAGFWRVVFWSPW
jgi:hypothetical protein